MRKRKTEFLVKAEITPETSAKLKKLVASFGDAEFKKLAQRMMRNMGAAIKRDLKGHLDDRYRLGAVGGFSRIARTRTKPIEGGIQMDVRGSRVPLVGFMTDRGSSHVRAKGHYGERPAVNVIGPTRMKYGDFYARVNVKARVGGDASYHSMIFRPQEGKYYESRYSLGMRVGAGRTKIKGLMTVSVPNMMSQEQVAASITASAGEHAQAAIERAVDKAFQSLS